MQLIKPSHPLAISLFALLAASSFIVFHANAAGMYFDISTAPRASKSEANIISLYHRGKYVSNVIISSPNDGFGASLFVDTEGKVLYHSCYNYPQPPDGPSAIEVSIPEPNATSQRDLNLFYYYLPSVLYKKLSTPETVPAEGEITNFPSASQDNFKVVIPEVDSRYLRVTKLTYKWLPDKYEENSSYPTKTITFTASLLPIGPVSRTKYQRNSPNISNNFRPFDLEITIESNNQQGDFYDHSQLTIKAIHEKHRSATTLLSRDAKASSHVSAKKMTVRSQHSKTKTKTKTKNSTAKPFSEPLWESLQYLVIESAANSENKVIVIAYPLIPVLSSDKAFFPDITGVYMLNMGQELEYQRDKDLWQLEQLSGDHRTQTDSITNHYQVPRLLTAAQSQATEAITYPPAFNSVSFLLSQINSTLPPSLPQDAVHLPELLYAFPTLFKYLAATEGSPKTLEAIVAPYPGEATKKQLLQATGERDGLKFIIQDNDCMIFNVADMDTRLQLGDVPLKLKTYFSRSAPTFPINITSSAQHTRRLSVFASASGSSEHNGSSNSSKSETYDNLAPRSGDLTPNSETGGQDDQYALARNQSSSHSSSTEIHPDLELEPEDTNTQPPPAPEYYMHMQQSLRSDTPAYYLPGATFSIPSPPPTFPPACLPHQHSASVTDNALQRFNPQSFYFPEANPQLPAVTLNKATSAVNRYSSPPLRMVSPTPSLPGVQLTPESNYSAPNTATQNPVHSVASAALALMRANQVTEPTFTGLGKQLTDSSLDGAAALSSLLQQALVLKSTHNLISPTKEIIEEQFEALSKPKPTHASVKTDDSVSTRPPALIPRTASMHQRPTTIPRSTSTSSAVQRRPPPPERAHSMSLPPHSQDSSLEQSAIYDIPYDNYKKINR